MPDTLTKDEVAEIRRRLATFSPGELGTSVLSPLAVHLPVLLAMAERLLAVEALAARMWTVSDLSIRKELEIALAGKGAGGE